MFVNPLINRKYNKAVNLVAGAPWDRYLAATRQNSGPLLQRYMNKRLRTLLTLLAIPAFALADNSYFIQWHSLPKTDINLALSKKLLVHPISINKQYRCSKHNGKYLYLYSTVIASGFILTPDLLKKYPDCKSTSIDLIPNYLLSTKAKLQNQIGQPINATSVALSYRYQVVTPDCNNSYYQYENARVYFDKSNNISSVHYELTGEPVSTCK